MSFKSIIVFIFVLFKLFKRILSPKKCDKETKYYKNYASTLDDDKNHAEDATVHPYRINVAEELLTDLKFRLSRTRFEEPLKDSEFANGFNPNYLEKLTQYWRSEYDWRKQEEELNSYPQFMTKIEGLDIHFIHVKANQLQEDEVKVIPLLLVHGWPGSCAYFHKVIQLLTKESDGCSYKFDLICPSIPGFGFSESPKFEGFNSKDACRVFLNLMDRLGYSRFYVQGCGWGAVIASLMGRDYPSRVIGIHVNMYFSIPKSFDSCIKFILMSLFPFMATSAERKTIFPIKKKLWMLYKETCSLHLQFLKPNTLDCAMVDSPAGMAAYILEKFAFATNPEYLHLPDGGLMEKFTIDELLTLVTICWANKNFSSSVRFCNESLTDVLNYTHEKVPLTVPVGIAVFPNELYMLPKLLMESNIQDLISYTVMPRGGHFAAMEETQILVEDCRNLVKLVEKRWPYGL